MDLRASPLDLFLPRNHPASDFLDSLVRALPVLSRDVGGKVRLEGRGSFLLRPIRIDCGPRWVAVKSCVYSPGLLGGLPLAQQVC